MRFLTESITGREYLVAHYVSFSFAAFLLALSLFLPGGVTEVEENSLYLLFFGGAPFVVYFVHRLTSRGGEADTPANRLVLFVNGWLMVGFGLYALRTMLSGGLPSALAVYAFTAAHVVGTTLVLLASRRGHALAVRLSGPAADIGNKVLFVVGPLVLVSLLLTDYQANIIQGLAANLSFQLGAVAGCGAGVLLIVRGRRLPAPLAGLSRRTALVSAGVFAGSILLILALFDPSLSFDPHHYNSYIGPAMAVVNGWIPFVDIHTHYGFLPFLLPVWLFQFVEPSYQALAAVVSVSSTLQLLVAFLILHRVVRKRLLFYVPILAAILFYKILPPFNGDALPSASGYRHLPSLLLLLSLCYLPRGRAVTVFSSAALVLCAFWSMDQLVYGLVTYLVLVIADGWVSGQPLTRIVRSVVIVGAIPVVAHAVFSVGMLLGYGTLPRYDLYLEVLQTFATGAFWAYPVDIHKLIFGFHVLVYSVVLAWSVRVVLGTRGEARQAEWESIRPLTLLAIIGVFHMQYFAGRSSEIALMFYSLPLVLLVTVLITRVAEERRQLFVRLAGVVLIVLSLSLGGGLIVERFVSPSSLAFSFSDGFRIDGADTATHASAPNISVLRRALQRGRSIGDVFADMRRELAERKPPTSVGPRPEQLGEVINLIRTWQPQQRQLLLFVPADIAVGALTYTNKALRYPMAFGTTDLEYPKKVAKILETPIPISDGDIVIAQCPVSREQIGMVNGRTVDLIFSDPAVEDRAQTWRQESDSLSFALDRYRFATSQPGKHVTRSDMYLRRGRVYELSVDLKDGTARGQAVELYVNDGVNNLYGPVVTTSPTWMTHTYRFTAAADTPNGWIGIRVRDSLQGGTIEIRNIVLYRPLEDAAGSSPTAVFSDQAAADNSRSWQREAAMLRFESNHYALSTSAPGQHVFRNDIALQTGEAYEVSMEVKDGSASSGAVEIYVNDGVNNRYSPAVTTTGTWTRHAYRFRASATGNGWIGIRLRESSDGATIGVRQILLARMPHDMSPRREIQENWCDTTALPPIEKAILSRIVAEWDAELLEVSDTDISVFKLKGRQ